MKEYEQKRTHDIHEIQTLRTQLQERGLILLYENSKSYDILTNLYLERTQNTAVSEREVQYQSELNSLRQEKNNLENQLNQTIKSLKQNHEKQIKELQNDVSEFSRRGEVIY